MRLGRFVPCAIVALAVTMFLDANLAAQIVSIGDMNTQQIRALDLAKTVILMPGDILEEHGPYLPSFTDGYADDAYTHELAKAIVAKPGWTIVIFFQIPAARTKQSAKRPAALDYSNEKSKPGVLCC